MFASNDLALSNTKDNPAITDSVKPLDQALAYAAQGWPVFPCIRGSKRPYIEHGFHGASREERTIRGWWQRWPVALIGMPTGAITGRNVLDVDVKDPAKYGFDTLDELGFAILPVTPIAHTASGGIHLHFARTVAIRNTTGAKGSRGIGPGLDWRGDGGYVILPADGSGYWWDPICGPEALLAPVPLALLPREPLPVGNPPNGSPPAQKERTIGVASSYADAALDSAYHRIIGAPNGEQESTLSRECLTIGSLAGAGLIEQAFALTTLLSAASQIPSYLVSVKGERRAPWTPAELENKVRTAFAKGLAHPRPHRAGEVRRYG